MEIGNKLGIWKVIEFIGKNKHGLKLWRCKCNCGAERILTISYLNMQKERGYKSCKECHGKDEDNELIKQFVGKKVGTWEILELKGRNKYGTRKWLCKCDCGALKLFTTCYLTGTYVRTATTCLSCTKINLELKNRIIDFIPQRFWQKFLGAAKRRNISVEVTKEEVFKKYLAQGRKCALTNLPLHFTKLRTHYNRYTNASIDRVNSKKPYTLDNVQWVEKRINVMKWAYPQEEFIELCKMVANK